MNEQILSMTKEISPKSKNGMDSIDMSPKSPSSVRTTKSIWAKRAAKANKIIKEQDIKYKKFLREPKLLLLGSCDSGKSTLLKQLKILYGDGFTAEEKSQYKDRFRVTLLRACKRILVDIPHLEAVKRHNIGIWATNKLRRE